jgi:hypothetical protein
MILVNGRELDEHGLRARVEARARCGLYPPRTLSLLERGLADELAEHGFSMTHVVYDLQWSLEESGWRLEPPPDLSTGEPGEKKSRLGALLRRMQTRFIRAVNEGYVQQQEKFNTCFTRGVDLSHRLLYGETPGAFREGMEGRDLYVSPRPAWGSETVEALCGEGCGRAVVIGIPGAALLEGLQEAGRLLIAVETCDRAVAECQAHYIPAFYHHRPVRFLIDHDPREVGLLVVSFPEGLEGREICELMDWAGGKMVAGGSVLLALNRGGLDGLPPQGGLVRYWPRRFLARSIRRAGLEASEWRYGERLFLKGDKKA